MSEEAGMPGPMSPADLWKQWYETSSKMWSGILKGGKETYLDPYSLYRLWVKSLEEAQEQMKPGISGIDPVEVWKQWFDAITDAWRRASEMGRDSAELSNQWLRILEETRVKLLSGEINSRDPVTFIKQWYDATSETWAQVVGEVISSDRFMEANRKFIESYTSAVKLSNRVNEEYLQNLQFPTRSDITRVAGLIVSLEEKVDSIEDTLDHLHDTYSHVATSEAVDNLAGRLTQVESKLGSLDTLPTVLERTEAIEGLTSRLDQVESKLDMLLSTLAKLEARERLETARASDHTRRKAQKKNEDSQEVKDTKSSVEV